MMRRPPGMRTRGSAVAPVSLRGPQDVRTMDASAYQDHLLRRGISFVGAVGEKPVVEGIDDNRIPFPAAAGGRSR